MESGDEGVNYSVELRDEISDLSVHAVLREELIGFVDMKVEASALKKLWLGYRLTPVLENNPLSA